MKNTILLIAFSLLIASVSGQVKKRTGVKRKYQNAEVVNEELPAVFLRGKIRNAANDLLSGVKVTIAGSLKEVNTNADGEYFFYGLRTGQLTIEASLMGFRTKATDFYVQTGQNYLNFTLDEDRAKTNQMVVTTQKREQQVLDVPAPVSVLDAEFSELTGLTEPEQISEFVPGIQVRMQGIHHPSITIRGITNDDIGAGSQPGLAVVYNNVPVSGLRSAIPGFFDMEQVEVARGPQGPLYGRNALAGAIHYFSHKPEKESGGYISAEIGNYYTRETKAAINLQVIKKKLFTRLSGMYSHRDGYVKNTEGGTLMGCQTAGGRFSLLFLPAYNKKLELVVNYLQDDNPGIAFMSGILPNTRGETGPFSDVASLGKGDLLKTKRELMDATLNFNHFYNEHFFWTSISSWRYVRTFERSDGDGTAAPAIDLTDEGKAWQIFQEIRFNYSSGNRLNGASGISLSMEKAGQISGFSTNEQSMFFLYSNPAGLVNESGLPFTISTIPVLPFLEALSGIPLPEDHLEETRNTAFNRSLEAYADGSLKILRNLTLTGGVRAVYDQLRLKGTSQFAGGNESALGRITGNYPNLLVPPYEEKKTTNNAFSITGRAVLKYNFNENTSIYAGASNGRRPVILYFTETGEGLKTGPEKITGLETGIKAIVMRRFWFEAEGFFQKYENFRAADWITDPVSGQVSHMVTEGNKASIYGVESALKAVIIRGIELFGNFAWTHARFSEVDSTHTGFAFSGKTFRLSPVFSFSTGLNFRFKVTKGTEIFAIPIYSWKSHFWFDQMNTPGLDQDEYGVLSASAGAELKKTGLTLSVFGTNLLNEPYLISAGNTGLRFGSPTFVPGAPCVWGTKVVWRF